MLHNNGKAFTDPSSPQPTLPLFPLLCRCRCSLTLSRCGGDALRRFRGAATALGLGSRLLSPVGSLLDEPAAQCSCIAILTFIQVGLRRQRVCWVGLGTPVALLKEQTKTFWSVPSNSRVHLQIALGLILPLRVVWWRERGFRLRFALERQRHTLARQLRQCGRVSE